MKSIFKFLLILSFVAGMMFIGSVSSPTRNLSAEENEAFLFEVSQESEPGFSVLNSNTERDVLITQLQESITQAIQLLAETHVADSPDEVPYGEWYAPKWAHDELKAALAFAQGTLDAATIKLNITPVTLAGGSNHSVAIRNGTVWTWGANNSGQLGNGSLNNSHVPVMVPSLKDVVAVSAGSLHTLALCNDGTVWAWGNNSSGVLGNGTNIASTVPVQVHNLSNVVSITTGETHNLALRSDGTVWAWGWNGFGRLGDGSTTARSTPVQVPNLNNIIAIAAGNAHSVALRNDGTVWTWGRNNVGQLGNGTTTDSLVPVQVRGLGHAIAIAAGDEHNMALINTGTVWTWGRNNDRQLGDGTTVQNRLMPVQVSNLNNVVAISSGTNHSFAIRGDGTAWAWGSNLFGQIGINSTGDQNIPVRPRNITNVTAITGGGRHSIAQTEDGIWAWGNNAVGQIGDDTVVTRRLVPVRVVDFEAPAEHAINISSTTGGTAISSRTSAVAGAIVNITASPEQNYRFVRWEVESGFANIIKPTSPNQSFIMQNSDVEIHAIFAPSAWPLHHPVMVSTVGSGTVTRSHDSATEGTQVTLTANPDTDHEFVRWEVIEDGVPIQVSSSPNLSFTMTDEPVLHRAVFGIPGGSITGVTHITTSGTMQAGQYSFSSFSVETANIQDSAATQYYVTLNNAPVGMTPSSEPGELIGLFSHITGLSVWINGATDGAVFMHGDYTVSMTLWCRDSGNHIATSEDFVVNVPSRAATRGVTIRSERADSPETAQLILRTRATVEERLAGNTRNAVDIIHDQYDLNESWYRVYLPAGRNYINLNPGGSGTERYADVAIFSASNTYDEIFDDRIRRPDTSPHNAIVREMFIAPYAGYYFIRITGDSPPGIGQYIFWSVGYSTDLGF